MGWFNNLLKEAAPVLGGIVGNAYYGDIGAAVGAAAGSKLAGKTTGDAIQAAALGYAGSNIATGYGYDPLQEGESFFDFFNRNDTNVFNADPDNISQYFQNIGANLGGRTGDQSLFDTLGDFGSASKAGIAGLSLAASGMLGDSFSTNDPSAPDLGGFGTAPPAANRLLAGLGTAPDGATATINDPTLLHHQLPSMPGQPQKAIGSVNYGAPSTTQAAQSGLASLVSANQTNGLIPSIFQTPLTSYSDLVQQYLAMQGQPQPAFAHGGAVRGAGGPKDDKITARLSDGEFVLTAEAVEGLGGPEQVYEMMYRAEDNASKPTESLSDIMKTGQRAYERAQKKMGEGRTLEELEGLFTDQIKGYADGGSVETKSWIEGIVGSIGKHNRANEAALNATTAPVEAPVAQEPWQRLQSKDLGTGFKSREEVMNHLRAGYDWEDFGYQTMDEMMKDTGWSAYQTMGYENEQEFLKAIGE